MSRHSWMILARKLGGRQSVCIAARSACWRQKRVSVAPQFEPAAFGLRVSHCARRYLYGWGETAVAVRTREIYRSANGDRGLLACDPDTGKVFVRHEPNLPSGGQVADIEVGAFLIAAGNGPEKQELVRLLERWSEVRLRRGPKGEKRPADVIGVAMCGRSAGSERDPQGARRQPQPPGLHDCLAYAANATARPPARRRSRDASGSSHEPLNGWEWQELWSKRNLRQVLVVHATTGSKCNLSV